MVGGLELRGQQTGRGLTEDRSLGAHGAVVSNPIGDGEKGTRFEDEL